MNEAMTKNFTLDLKPPVGLWMMFLLMSLCTQAQSHLVRGGVVTDSQGEPLPGVTILLKDTSLGTSTGTDGAYQLSSPQPLQPGAHPAAEILRPVFRRLPTVV